MADITARKDVHFQDGVILPFKVEEATTIQEGAAVCVNAAGYAVNANAVAGNSFVGVADRKADNSAGADGDIDVFVRTTGVCDFIYEPGDADQADVGTLVYAHDNQTVDLAAGGATDSLVGRIVEVLSATKVRVQLQTTAGPSA